MLNATLVDRIDITKDLTIFRVLPDSGVGNFQSGQYMALGLMGDAARGEGLPPEPEPATPGKLIKRAYSIGSAPDEKGFLEFYIAIVPTGALTSRLVRLNVGDRLYAAPKIAGTFTLAEVAPEKNLILVATGTGLAPFVSMVRSKSTWTPGRQITILHGVRYERDLAYRDELLTLSREMPLRYIAYVSREEEKEGIFRKGYVQRAFDGGLVPVDSARDNVFLCGNPSMVEEVEALLIGKGFTVHSKKTPGNLHVEKYW